MAQNLFDVVRFFAGPHVARASGAESLRVLFEEPAFEIMGRSGADDDRANSICPGSRPVWHSLGFGSGEFRGDGEQSRRHTIIETLQSDALDSCPSFDVLAENSNLAPLDKFRGALRSGHVVRT